MAYIQPNSSVTLYYAVPLDNTYDHTVYFANSSEQTAWFNTFTRKVLTDQSYTRHSAGVLRLGVSAESVIGYNYMTFDNPRTGGNKKYFAFITDTEYVNENTCNVKYEIDEMQTWLFEADLEPSFVEREHSATDAIGDNCVPEGLNTGLLTVENSGPLSTSLVTNYTYIIGAIGVAYDPQLQQYIFGDPEPHYYNNSISNMSIIEIYPAMYADYGIQAFKDLWAAAEAEGKTDQILFVTVFPKSLVDLVYVGTQPTTIPAETLSWSVNTATLHGYYPRNKKLFTREFHYIELTDLNGSTNDYYCEYLATPSVLGCSVMANLSVAPTTLRIAPKNYKDVAVNQNEAFIFSAYPTFAFATNQFKEWLARNGEALNMRVATAGISSALSAMGDIAKGSMPSAGTVLSPIQEVFNVQTQVNQAQKQADRVRGVQGDLNTFFTNNCAPYIYEYAVTQEYAKIIDDYFSMYGYATHRVKIPNRHVRANWTYCKTRGCNIHGPVPSASISKLQSIYDRGITFWDKNTPVGSYQTGGSWRSNSII